MKNIRSFRIIIAAVSFILIIVTTSAAQYSGGNGSAEISQLQDDVSAIRPLANNIIRMSRVNHAPNVRLIRINSYYNDSQAAVFVLPLGMIFGVLTGWSVLQRRACTNKSDNQWIAIVFSAVLAVGLLALGTYLFVSSYQEWKDLAREGLEARAIVIGQWEEHHGKSNVHYIAYLFVAHLPDGSTRTVACRIDNDKQIRAGDELLVRYLPSDLELGGPVWPWLDRHYGSVSLLALVLGTICVITFALLFLRH